MLFLLFGHINDQPTLNGLNTTVSLVEAFFLARACSHKSLTERLARDSHPSPTPRDMSNILEFVLEAHGGYGALGL